MIDIYLTNLEMKSILKKAVYIVNSKYCCYALDQNNFKKIDEDSKELFCRKKIKRDNEIENLCNKEDAQKNKKDADEKF